MVMKKIFSDKCDEEVHSDFLKFSRGEFKDRYLIEAKKQKDKWAIKTSSEFVNFLVRKCLEKVSGNIDIKGVIITTLNLGNDDELGFKIKKRGNFQGIKKLEIETNLDTDKILKLMEKYPRVFFALSFKTDKFELKVKPKAPKSGKPGKNDEDAKADFCSIKTADKSIVDELLFDVPHFNEIKVNHTIKIDEIVYPKNIEGMKPEEVRENSKRKGTIIRNLIIDGVEKKEQHGFVA